MFRLNGRHRLWNRQTAMPIAAAAGAGLVFDGPGAALAAALLAVPFGLIAGRGLPGVWKTTGEDAATAEDGAVEDDFNERWFMAGSLLTIGILGGGLLIASLVYAYQHMGQR